MMGKILKQAGMMLMALALTGALGACSGKDGQSANTAFGDTYQSSQEQSGTQAAATDGGEMIVEFNAQDYVATLCNGDTSSLTELYSYTDEMTQSLESTGGLEALQAEFQTHGEFQGAGEPEVSQSQGYTFYSVPCRFSGQNFNVVVSVDSEGKIDSIETAQYTGEAVDTTGGETLTMPEG